MKRWKRQLYQKQPQLRIREMLVDETRLIFLRLFNTWLKNSANSNIISRLHLARVRRGVYISAAQKLLSLFHTGLPDMGQKWARFWPNGINIGFFQTRFGKKYWKWFWKVLNLSHLVPIWPNICPNLAPKFPACGVASPGCLTTEN